MRIVSRLMTFLLVSLLLSSCQFQCKMGDVKGKEKPVVNKPVHTDEGAIIYNGIQVNAHKVKVNKAYLVLKNGERVPDDNFVDFTQDVKMILLINEGWVEENGKVLLGVSEKVVAENGTVLLDQEDLFSSNTEGLTAADAKILGLSVTFDHVTIGQPTYMSVYYKIWDKKGEGYVEGSYKLYSK